MKKIPYSLLLFLWTTINYAQTPPPCSTDIVVVIDGNKVTDQWRTDNWGLFCTKKIPNTSISDYLVVDVDKVSTDPVEIAKWLANHKSIISFPDSSPFIRRAHLLTDYSLVKEIEIRAAIPTLNYEVKFDTFVSSIPDFKSKSYETYIKFEDTDKNGVIDKYSEITPGQTDSYSYSIPFFKSIIDTYKIDSSEYGEYKLNFVTFEYATAEPTPVVVKVLAFKISKGKSFAEFYDYSTNPGTPSMPQTTPPGKKPTPAATAVRTVTPGTIVLSVRDLL